MKMEMSKSKNTEKTCVWWQFMILCVKFHFTAKSEVSLLGQSIFLNGFLNKISWATFSMLFCRKILSVNPMFSIKIHKHESYLPFMNSIFLIDKSTWIKKLFSFQTNTNLLTHFSIRWYLPNMKKLFKM